MSRQEAHAINAGHCRGSGAQAALQTRVTAATPRLPPYRTSVPGSAAWSQLRDTPSTHHDSSREPKNDFQRARGAHHPHCLSPHPRPRHRGQGLPRAGHCLHLRSGSQSPRAVHDGDNAQVRPYFGDCLGMPSGAVAVPTTRASGAGSLVRIGHHSIGRSPGPAPRTARSGPTPRRPTRQCHPSRPTLELGDVSQTVRETEDLSVHAYAPTAGRRGRIHDGWWHRGHAISLTRAALCASSERPPGAKGEPPGTTPDGLTWTLTDGRLWPCC